MAALAQLSFLLFALTNNIHAEEFTIILKQMDPYTFEAPKQANFCLISKFVVSEGKQVLLNTSDLWSPNSTAPEQLKGQLPAVRKVNDSTYSIGALAQSHSGLYQQKCWMEGNVAYEKNIRIVVCGTTEEITYTEVHLGESFELPCKGAAGDLTVQWLQRHFKYGEERWTNVFEDSTSLLMDDEKRKFKVEKNTSALVVSRYKFITSDLYTCLVMDKQQCVSSHPVHPYIPSELSYHWVGEKTVLDCTGLSNDDQPLVWRKYDTFKLLLFGSNFRVVGQNPTLVFSSLTLNDSACYSCENSARKKEYILQVCPKNVSLAVVFFSEGEVVNLTCSLTGGVTKSWMMKSKQTGGRIVSVNGHWHDEVGRVRIYYSGSDLVLFNVSLEYTGEYWCMVCDEDIHCLSTSKILLVHRDAESEGCTDHAVRSSLLTAALLVLCVTVVAVTRRTGRGEQSAPV